MYQSNMLYTKLAQCNTSNLFIKKNQVKKETKLQIYLSICDFTQVKKKKKKNCEDWLNGS